jgi:FkbM family methyltransferase
MTQTSLVDIALTVPARARNWVERRLRRVIFSQSEQYLRHIHAPTGSAHLIRYGTDYGGRVIDDKIARETISPEDFVLSCGAGQDISFDIEIQRHYGCHVIIVDPTPLAIDHYNGLIQASRRGEAFSIEDSDSRFYDLNGVNLNKIHLYPFAVWKEDTKLLLWAPRKSTHVSHSVTHASRSADDLHSSVKYIEVQARTVARIMSDYKIDSIPLLKLDIMRAELAVLESMIEAGIHPRQISVKLYDLSFPKSDTYGRLRTVVDSMVDKNYLLLNTEDPGKYLFIRP